MILPYRFEPNSLWSSSEESDSNDTNSQASFTERLDNTSWCSCVKCLLNPHAIECICYHKLSEVEEHLEGRDDVFRYLETFKKVCLDKVVLYTALVTIHTVKGDSKLLL